MFDIEKYECIQKILNNYEEKINYLELIKKDLENIKYNIQDECNHDLILCYVKENDTEVKHAKCLFCDTYLELIDNFEMFSERFISQENIMDVTKKVSKTIQKRNCNNESVLVLKAKEKLNDMINYSKDSNINLNIEFVKNTIINELIKYDEEFKNERRKTLIKDNKKK